MWCYRRLQLMSCRLRSFPEVQDREIQSLPKPFCGNRHKGQPIAILLYIQIESESPIVRSLADALIVAMAVFLP